MMKTISSRTKSKTKINREVSMLMSQFSRNNFHALLNDLFKVPLDNITNRIV